MEDDRLLGELEGVVEGDPRYKLEAYVFVMRALEVTLARLHRAGHLTGRELLEGVRGYAKERFGPMAKTVFEHWGIKKTDDFGEIVFGLVDAGILGKTAQDSKDDFRDVYDFSEVFEKQYDWKIERDPRVREGK